MDEGIEAGSEGSGDSAQRSLLLAVFEQDAKQWSGKQQQRPNIVYPLCS